MTGRELTTAFILSAVAAVVTGTSAGCVAPPEEETVASGEQDVIGGIAESRYAAVGYLGFETWTRENGVLAKSVTVHCGATLISPHVAVTAAHCTSTVPGNEALVFGLGEPNDRRWAKIWANVSHPRFSFASGAHDIAVLYLDEPILGIVPATIAALGSSSEGDVLRYVGYGRTTVGPMGGRASGLRKSARQEVTPRPTQGIGADEIRTIGLDGGLCTGDSGGPLMAESDGNVLHGVLSQVPRGMCEPGNVGVFTAAAEHADFLVSATKCHEQAYPNTCIRALLDDPSLDKPDYCSTACRPESAAPGTCDGLRHCDGTCMRPGCPANGPGREFCHLWAARRAMISLPDPITCAWGAEEGPDGCSVWTGCDGVF